MGLWRKFLSRVTKVTKDIYAARRAFWFVGRTQVTEDSSMQVAAFNRGLIYISTQIAKLPWDVKDADNKILQNPISDMLNLAPNDEMNAFSFKLFLIQQAIIHGNAYAEIERNTVGTPIAMHPLDSCSMELMRSESGKLVYKYNNPDGAPSYMRPMDVYHLKNFHTKDGLVGQGVVAYGRDVLGIQIAADAMASGIFHNSGIPSGIIKHPGKMSDEAYARLKESWDAQHGGKKTGGTAVLEEGAMYESINTDPDALQFLESRQFGVLEIARFLGLPPTKLFDTAASTYSNTENANLEVATDTLDSWATNLEMEADVKLLNYRFGGRFTDIDLYSIFRGDMKTRSDYFKSMISIGAMTPNQIRSREGMSPYKEGDDYYIATNNFTPVSRMDEIIDADIKQKTKSAEAPAPSRPTETSALEDAAINFLKKA